MSVGLPWLTLDTWIISDTHFGHKNIQRYCSRPAGVDELMRHNWKTLVRPDDHVLHLGDIAWRGRHTMPRDLPGIVHFIAGNHDHRPMIKLLMEELKWEKLEHRVVKTLLDRSVCFSHYPNNALDWITNVHGHIHNNGWRTDTPQRDRRNVSVEVINYRPVRLNDVLRGRAGELQ